MKKYEGWSPLGRGMVFRENEKEVGRLGFRNGFYVMKKGTRGLESQLESKNISDAKKEFMEIMFGPEEDRK